MTNDNKKKRYYWIKLKDTFFTSDTVDFLMSQKNGANYVVLYQMLCLKTVNTNGELSRQIGEIMIPFDVDKIQRDCKYFDIDTIRVALELYTKLGLIFVQEDGTMQITDYANMVGSETNSAIEKREQRLLAKGIDKGIDNVYQEKDIRDKIIENRDKSIDNIYTSIKDAYNSTCVKLPKCTTLSVNRKKAIKCRVDTYGIDGVLKAIKIASESDFLAGKNDRNWKADIDWIMKDSSMAKILDGKYDNRATTYSAKQETKKERKYYEDIDGSIFD